MRASRSGCSSSGSSWAGRHGSRGGALGNQPVAQRQRGPDVVLVVGGDAFEDGGVGCGHVELVLDDGGSTLVDVVAASVVGEALHVLQAVGLRSDLDGVAHDRIEVDEETGLDHVGQHRFTDTVFSRQTLEG